MLGGKRGSVQVAPTGRANRDAAASEVGFHCCLHQHLPYERSHGAAANGPWPLTTSHVMPAAPASPARAHRLSRYAGTQNCGAQGVSALEQQYGGLAAAAAAPTYRLCRTKLRPVVLDGYESAGTLNCPGWPSGAAVHGAHPAQDKTRGRDRPPPLLARMVDHQAVTGLPPASRSYSHRVLHRFQPKPLPKDEEGEIP
jgi:hypothetical protein